VPIDSFGGEHELVSDCQVGASVRDQLQHFPLASSQAARRRDRVGRQLIQVLEVRPCAELSEGASRSLQIGGRRFVVAERAAR
jgi:hypothetical protein